MTLGQTIQAYRKRAALSQEALAELVGVSRQAVSKWELDEATPEISKLKALAAAFGITVDQLLSGEIPASAEEPAAEPTAAREPSKAESLLNALPRFLGRLFRKYGWLAGVYIALSGLGTTVVGCLARFTYSGFFGALGGGITGLGVGWSVSATDRFGNPLSPSELQQLMDQFGVTSSHPVSGFAKVFLTLSNLVILIGIVTMIAGVALALYLRKKRQE